MRGKNVKKAYFLFALFFSLNTQGQIHKIESIDPDFPGFKDIEFLQKEFSDKKVIMLGEPSHREGNVFSAKIRLIKFLHEKMGYNTLAFESGFFELWQAQEKIDNNQNINEAILSGVFPIWSRAKEFQPLIDYLKEQKGKLRLIGFDPQIDKPTAKIFLPKLKGYILDQHLIFNLNELLIEEVLESLSEGIFPDGVDFSVFLAEIRKARGVISKSKNAQSPLAKCWIQQLKSIEALASDYYHNRPGEKTAEEYKASDSNPRDIQMADNLLFWINQDPQEKIICWGAALHFSVDPGGLENEELKKFRSMGKVLRDRIGNDEVYTLATVTSGGQYAAWFEENTQDVLSIMPSSIEDIFVKQSPAAIQYMDSKSLKDLGSKFSSMFDYTPLKGEWFRVVNGILFIDKYTRVHPETQSKTQAQINGEKNTFTEKGDQLTDSKNVLSIRKSGAYMTQGNVRDRDDDELLPSATLQLIGSNENAVSSANGSFKMMSQNDLRGKLLKISMVGYQDTTIRIDGSFLNIKLRKANILLEEIQIRPSDENAVKIVKKAFAALDQNIDHSDYTIDFYVESNVANKDSLNYDVEYTGKFYNKKGEEKYLSKVEEVHWIKKIKSADQQTKNAIRYLDGYQHINGANIVLQHPMFNEKAISKFKYDILKDSDDYYLIGFESRTRAHSYTNAYYLKRLTGSLLINKADFGIIKTQLTYELDTTTLNRFARNFERKKENNSTIFINLLDKDIVNIITSYQRDNKSFYYPMHTTITRRQTGKSIKDGSSMTLQANTEIFFKQTDKKASDSKEYQKIINFNQVKYNKDFWQKFQRPQQHE